MWSSVGEGKKFLSCRGDVVVDRLGGSAYSGSVNVLQTITCIGLHVFCLQVILVELRVRRPSSRPLWFWRVCCGKSLTWWQVDCPAFLTSRHDDEDHPVSPA